MDTKPASNHIREHKSLLAKGEKRLLLWIAKRLPRWVKADHLTFLGLGATLSAGLFYWGARWDRRILILVVVSLAANWFGDSLDGTLARLRKQERPRYGYYVDHVFDVVGAVFILGGLAASGYIHPLIAMGLLVGYLLVAAESFLATHAQGVFRLSSMGFGPTELRILLAAGTLYVIHSPTVRMGSLGSLRLFDVGGAIGTAGLVAALVASAIRNGRALYRAEPLTK